MLISQEGRIIEVLVFVNTVESEHAERVGFYYDLRTNRFNGKNHKHIY